MGCAAWMGSCVLCACESAGARGGFDAIGAVASVDAGAGVVGNDEGGVATNEGAVEAAAGDEQGGPLDATAPTDGSDAAGEDDRGAAGGPSVDASETGPGDIGAGKNPKRGLAYSSPQNLADFRIVAPGIGWWYDWSLSPNGMPTDARSPEFVPMAWTSNYTQGMLDAIPRSAKYLLAFNEPNFGNQANLTPQQAASAWPVLQAFAKSRGMKIVSPAVNYCTGNCNQTDPYVWLAAFLAACPGCEVDFIGVHAYVCQAGALASILLRYEKTFQKPLWLTEFSCLDGSSPPTVQNEQSYMRDALAVLDADPMVFRYAWFTSRSTQTVVDVFEPLAIGQLSALGQEYVTLP
jgi:hypothetical protein